MTNSLLNFFFSSPLDEGKEIANPGRGERWAKLFIALAIITLLLFPNLKLPEVNPVRDEVYHITDDMADGTSRALNPFSENYEFLGHPPGYPWSIYVWMLVTGKTYISAHYYALGFTFLGVFALYLFSSLYLSFFASLAVAVFFVYAGPVGFYADRSYGNMPAVALILLSIYALATKQLRWMFVFISLAVFMRESSIEVCVALLALYPFVQKNAFERRQLLYISILPVVALGLFFLANYYFFGSFSRHPYAEGAIAHVKEPFFALSWGKLQAMKTIAEWIKHDMPPLVVFVPIGMLSLYLHPFSGKGFLKLGQGVFLLSGIFSFSFFTLYADIAPRDIVVMLAVSAFYFAFAVERLMPPRIAVMVTVVLIGLCLYKRQERFFNYSNRLRLEAEMLTQQARYVEDVQAGKEVCLQWPLDHLENIHGYFKNISEIKKDCKNPRVVCLDSYMSKDRFSQEQQKMTARDFVKLVDFKKTLIETDESFDVFFECWGAKELRKEVLIPNGQVDQAGLSFLPEETNVAHKF